MSSKCGYKRKLYLIDKDFQFGYLLAWLTMALGLVGGMVLTTLTLFFFFQGSLFRYSIEISAGLAVMFTGLSLYYMVRHSHRVAGPAYRLEFVLRELARGDFDLRQRVHLRKRDYLKQVAGALNDLIEIREREQEHVRALMAGMSELNSAVQSTPGMASAMKKLSKRMHTEMVELSEVTRSRDSWHGTEGDTPLPGSNAMRTVEYGSVGCVTQLCHSGAEGMGDGFEEAEGAMETELVESVARMNTNRTFGRSTTARS